MQKRPVEPQAEEARSAKSAMSAAGEGRELIPVTLRGMNVRISEDELIDLLNQLLAENGPMRSRIACTVLAEADKIIAEHLLHASVHCECLPCKSLHQILAGRKQ